MNDRRDFLQKAALTALITTTATAATNACAADAHKARGEIARYPLSGDLAGKDAVLVDLVAQPKAPNSTGGGHRHPGMVLGYVIDGAFNFTVDGGPNKVIHAGETFYEPARALHTNATSADPDKPAHLLAFMIVPSGEKLVLPA